MNSEYLFIYGIPEVRSYSRLYYASVVRCMDADYAHDNLFSHIPYLLNRYYNILSRNNDLLTHYMFNPWERTPNAYDTSNTTD